KVGDTFDLIVAPQGITIADSGLSLLNFVTSDGVSLLQGLTLASFDSGIGSDPDRLLQIDKLVFRLDLVDNNTILRATLVEPVPLRVPEPATVLLASLGTAIFLFFRYSSLAATLCIPRETRFARY